jgi:starch phosphorylase
MGRKNKSSNEADPQDEGSATETQDQASSKNNQKEEEKNGAQEAPKATPKKDPAPKPKTSDNKNDVDKLNQPLAKSNRKGSKFDLQG